MIFSRDKVRSGGIPVHEMLEAGLCLALVGGFLDAYTYYLHGGVFCNAQTGNLILMCLSLAEGDFLRSVSYLVPILAFVVGTAAAVQLKLAFIRRQALNWYHLVLVAEAAVLFLIGLLPEGVPHFIISAVISFVCSLQVSGFQKLEGAPFATTYCTGNIRSATENAVRYLNQKDRGAGRKSLQYAAVILFFCLGVAAGRVASIWLKGKSIWFCSLLLLFAAGMMSWFEKRKEEGEAAG
ncbi:MAG: YoaK family protein [Peptococcaceae bacterium]|nr:YoaK family protein [Peptococcaceae bacterium]